MIIKCTGCGRLINEDAGSCPECGMTMGQIFEGTSLINQEKNSKPVGRTAKIIKTEIGDIITMGSYLQQKEPAAEKEAIEWLVLDVNVSNHQALLISEKILAIKPYHSKIQSVKRSRITWEKSTIRDWLNEIFFYEAFNDDEQRAIMTTKLENDDNPDYATEGGEDTSDRIFLLSIKKARELFEDNKERICELTPYALQQVWDEWKETEKYTYNEVVNTCAHGFWWWLRSPGNAVDREINTANVDCNGRVDTYGDSARSHSGGVRPAFWVDLAMIP